MTTCPTTPPRPPTSSPQCSPAMPTTGPGLSTCTSTNTPCPYAVFSVRSPGAQHRYHYARFDGARWHVAFLAHAGGELYRGEPSYTGLAALDPHSPERAFISTNVHPATGDALVSTTDDRRHHEIYEGVTDRPRRELDVDRHHRQLHRRQPPSHRADLE